MSNIEPRAYPEYVQAFTDRVRARGPNRILVEEDRAVGPREWADRFLEVPIDVIFIRQDGWSLGCPRSLEVQAEAMYPSDWLGSLRLGDEGAWEFVPRA